MDKVVSGVERALAVIAVLLLPAWGTQYITPSGRADFSHLTNRSNPNGIRDSLAAKPEANFPANLAVVRIQAPKYRSHGAESYADGDFSVVMVREIEEDSHFKRLQAMPKVAGVVPLNRLLIPPRVQGNEQLREAAAKLQADILLEYTVDTGFYDQQHSAPLSIISLGFLPTKNVRVSSTAAALLIDVRSGFIYGAAEDTQRAEETASFWSTTAAVDETRRKTEKAAFESLIGKIEKMWAGLAGKYSA